MSRRYSVWCIMLTVLSLWASVGLPFLPLIGVIQNLTAGTNSEPSGFLGLAVRHPIVLPVMAFTFAALCIILARRGVVSDQGRKPWWVSMIVFNSLSAAFCLAMVVVAPKFAALFTDLFK